MPDNSSRPLSPHLQIYRWQWTMSYSILHRITGVAIFGGLVIFSFWLFSLAFLPLCFETMTALSGFWLIKIGIWGWVWCLFFHLSNGIRHLIWDTGRWLDLTKAGLSGHFGLFLAVLFTATGYFIYTAG